MSAEDVKETVRKYCDEHAPGWECADVSIRVGELREAKNEILLVLPTPPSPLPPPSARSA